MAMAADRNMRNENLLSSSGGLFALFAPAAHEIVCALKEVDHAQDLPEAAHERLTSVVKDCENFLKNITTPMDVMSFAIRLTHVVGLLDHAHAGSEAPRRSRVERAFEHLNRSLVVDGDLKGRWLRAFMEREEECEKLGAVHLLQHGVFAFKPSTRRQ
jgi:hypothetical protein